MCTSCPGVHNQWSVTAGSYGKALTASLGMIIALWARANKLKSHSARNPVGLQLQLCKALKCNYLKYASAHFSLISFWYVDPYIFINISVFAELSLLIVMSLSLLRCLWVFWVGSRMYQHHVHLTSRWCSAAEPLFLSVSTVPGSTWPRRWTSFARAWGGRSPPTCPRPADPTSGRLTRRLYGRANATSPFGWVLRLQTTENLDLSVWAVK